MLNILGLKSRNLITVPLDIPNVTVISVNRNERGDVYRFRIRIDVLMWSTTSKSCQRLAQLEILRRRFSKPPRQG